MKAGRITIAKIAALVFGFGVVAGPGIALANSEQSHTTNFQTASGTVGCGIALVYGTHFDAATGGPLDGRWPGLQCSAPGIQPPGSNAGDPFVQLGQGRAGRARLVELGDDDLIYNRASRTLAPGTTWTRDRITCSIRSRSITCSSSSGHGFTLREGKLTRH